jgi:DNA repair exonuclease SbcCD ATPase subunit
MSDKTNSELVKELLEAFSSLKQKMEDPGYAALDSSISQLIQNQKDMREDLSELKKRLLNPYDGAIVEIRKNTDFRQDWEKRQRELDKLQEEHRDLVKWKSGFVKVFWTLFTTATGVIAYLVTNILNK